MTTPSTEGLKPCPICGGPAHAQQEDHPETWWIGCETNGCVATDTHIQQDDAIAVWNRRPAQASEAAILVPVNNLHWKNKHVSLNGYAFANCVFEDCTFDYEGTYSMIGCKILSTTPAEPK